MTIIAFILLICSFSAGSIVERIEGEVVFEGNGHPLSVEEGDTVSSKTRISVKEGELVLVKGESRVFVKPQSEFFYSSDSVKEQLILKEGTLWLSDYSGAYSIVCNKTVFNSFGGVVVDHKKKALSMTVWNGIGVVQIPRRKRGELLRSGYKVLVDSLGYGKRQFALEDERINCDLLPCDVKVSFFCEPCPKVDPVEIIDRDTLPILIVNPFLVENHFTLHPLSGKELAEEMAMQKSLYPLVEAEVPNKQSYRRQAELMRDSTKRFSILDASIIPNKENVNQPYCLISLFSGEVQEYVIKDTIPFTILEEFVNDDEEGEKIRRVDPQLFFHIADRIMSRL